jgi:superfamily II DNA/RNA helicase
MQKKFEDFKLSADILKALKLLGYEKPTPVQSRVINDILNQSDIIVRAQTGSGKTAAFAVPICELVDWEENKPQALVVTPTRELALQVKEEFFNIGRFKKLKACAVFGKAPFNIQARELKQKMHVVVGTPGRLIDHLSQGTFDVSKIKYLVVDEADELLNMGFVDQLHEIIEALPKERVTLLFSATVPPDIKALCDRYMSEPDLIEIESASHALDRINQRRYAVSNRDKLNLLKNLLILENPDTCIVFCNTRLEVDAVYEAFDALGYPSGRIHGGMNQRDRMREMDGFKKGKFRYLIATGVAARGIDVDDVSLIVNYDFPEDAETYVHRIGRTGRKGRTGQAVSFVTGADGEFIEAVEAYTERPIVELACPDQDAVEEARPAFIEKLNQKPEAKVDKGTKLNQGILKLHINAGKKQKMRAADIVGTLCNIEGMTKDDIGIINILDISTYVEVLHGKGETVLKTLQKKPLKGRIRKVSKADDELFPGERRARRDGKSRGQHSGHRKSHDRGRRR